MRFVYLMLVIIAVAALPEERPRVFCGRALAEARILYCFGPEVAETVKRSFSDSSFSMNKRVLFWPWLANRLYKRTPGLVDECCLKPCYVDQLLSYC